MTDAQKNAMDDRVDTLRRHAIQSSEDEVSEATLEADIRSDVFGYIREDRSLRIDKRAYEFIERNSAAGPSSVKKRVPDATMGLRAYTDLMKRVPLCEREECVIDHGPEAHDKLDKEKLLTMTREGECGLVVDGVWGKAEVIFPWGVYEAKRKGINPEHAEDQVVHAARAYLGMLDDLARDPEDVTKYQFKDSCDYQVFCFTSCGAYWTISVAYPVPGSCKFEVLWQGNVIDYSNAYDLLCITDQIQKHANTRHRDFVIKHLDAWYKRYDKFHKPAKPCITAREKFEAFLDSIPLVTPGWEKLKREARVATRVKASLTRKRRQASNPNPKRRRLDSVEVPEEDSLDLHGEVDAVTTGVDVE